MLRLLLVGLTLITLLHVLAGEALAGPFDDLAVPAGVESAALSPDGRRVAVGSENQTVVVWDVTTGRELQRLQGAPPFITTYSFGPDTSIPSCDPVSYVQFSPDASMVAAGGEDGTVRVYDVSSGKLLGKTSATGQVTGLAFFPRGHRVVVSSSSTRYLESSVDVLDLDTGKTGPNLDLSAHSGTVTSVAVSQDGTRLATGSVDKTVIVWNASSGAQIRVLKPGAEVRALAFAPDGRLAAATQDGVVLWDADGGLIVALPQFKGAQSVRFEPGSGTLVSAHGNTELAWDLKARRPARIQKWPEGIAGVNAGLTVQSRGSTLTVREIATGKTRQTLHLATPRIPWATFRPAVPPAGAKAGQEWTNPRDGSVLVYVPPGPFTMGNNEEDDAKPARQVTLPGCWMGKYEVTNAQFATFLNALGNRRASGCVPWHWLTVGIEQRPDGRYAAVAGQENHPVVDASWYGARAYCAWAGLRLPSEAEWEKAARGTDARVYPWGNAWDPSRATCEDNAPQEGGTRPVGALPASASPYGCLDMAGNASEMTMSRHLPYPYRPDGSREALGGDDERVVRGGFASAPAAQIRTFDRSTLSVGRGNAGGGFRVAR